MEGRGPCDVAAPARPGPLHRRLSARACRGPLGSLSPLPCARLPRSKEGGRGPSALGSNLRGPRGRPVSARRRRRRRREKRGSARGLAAPLAGIFLVL